MKLMPILSVAAIVLAACAAAPSGAAEHGADVQKLVAVMRPTQGHKAAGTLNFTQTPEGVRVQGNFRNLTPNSKHAIHIHQFGDPRGTDGTAAGGHYNPEGHEHGLPTKDMRHAGDLGNLETDAEGKAKINLVVTNVSLAGMKNPIIGRGVIVHEKADDGGQPVGNAGGRIAVGVIGIANPEFKPTPGAGAAKNAPASPGAPKKQ